MIPSRTRQCQRSALALSRCSAEPVTQPVPPLPACAVERNRASLRVYPGSAMHRARRGCDGAQPLDLAGHPRRRLVDVGLGRRAAETEAQRRAGERIGGINKFFQVASRARLQAKELKKSNRRLYYLSKWVLTTIVEDHVNNFVPMKFQDK